MSAHAQSICISLKTKRANCVIRQQTTVLFNENRFPAPGDQRTGVAAAMSASASYSHPLSATAAVLPTLSRPRAHGAIPEGRRLCFSTILFLLPPQAAVPCKWRIASPSSLFPFHPCPIRDSRDAPPSGLFTPPPAWVRQRVEDQENQAEPSDWKVAGCLHPRESDTCFRG